jgi:hypothetical protein
MKRLLVTVSLLISGVSFGLETCLGYFSAGNKVNVTCFDGTNEKTFVVETDSQTKFLYQMALKQYRLTGVTSEPNNYNFYFQKD